MRNAVNRIEIPNNENTEEITDIVEEILNFDEQQNGKAITLNFDRENLKC